MNSGQRVLQLFAMDDDGTNVEQIGHLNLAMALHPQVLLDGRIAFSSWEEHGLRDPRQFPLWVIGPDGRGWISLSGFSETALAHHFMTQMPGGDLVVTRYYNLNNNGFGDLVRYPLDPPGPDFGSPDATFSRRRRRQDPFPSRSEQVRLTPFTTPDDFPAPCPGWEDNAYASSGIEGPSPCAGAERRGKFTHPAAAPSAVGDPAQGRPPGRLLARPGQPQRHLRLPRHRPRRATTARSSCIPDGDADPRAAARASRAGRPSSSPWSPRTASTSSGRGRW